MEQAKADLDTAVVNMKGKRHYAVVLFCEQALEKALKALWLKEKKKQFPFVHDLTFFMKQLNLPKTFETVCMDLTSAYTETRYPSQEIPLKKFSEHDAKDFLKETKEALEWIKKRV